MAEFTADLNPKKTGNMDLGDLLKMDEAMSKGRLYKDAMKARIPTPAPVTPSNMVKSSIDDVGVPFRFNNSQKE